MDGPVHAFLHVSADQALATAADVDARRSAGAPVHPLAGVPIAVKDVVVTRGLPTTAGSAILRDWVPPYDATLVQKIKSAGLLSVLPDFAIAMDAFLFGARRAIHIHLPTCSQVSRDEATLVALCGLAQSDHDTRMMASLDVLMAPTASRVAGIRLKAFAVALGHAGLRLAPAAGEPGARLN